VAKAVGYDYKNIHLWGSLFLLSAKRRQPIRPWPDDGRAAFSMW
jgi:hypothetical protein